MQVEAYGGLPSSTRRQLREIAEALRRGDPDAVTGGFRIKPGTQLIRHWKDQRYTITALEDGFACDGKVYKSLSSIAKAITGVSWNGFTFFGIKRAPAGNKNAAGAHNLKSSNKRHRADRQPLPDPADGEQLRHA